jgi:hypothetical protein
MEVGSVPSGAASVNVDQRCPIGQRSLSARMAIGYLRRWADAHTFHP